MSQDTGEICLPHLHWSSRQSFTLSGNFCWSLWGKPTNQPASKPASQPTCCNPSTAGYNKVLTGHQKGKETLYTVYFSKEDVQATVQWKTRFMINVNVTMYSKSSTTQLIYNNSRGFLATFYLQGLSKCKIQWNEP